VCRKSNVRRDASLDVFKIWGLRFGGWGLGLSCARRAFLHLQNESERARLRERESERARERERATESERGRKSCPHTHTPHTHTTTSTQAHKHYNTHTRQTRHANRHTHGKHLSLSVSRSLTLSAALFPSLFLVLSLTHTDAYTYAHHHSRKRTHTRLYAQTRAYIHTQRAGLRTRTLTHTRQHNTGSQSSTRLSVKPQSSDQPRLDLVEMSTILLQPCLEPLQELCGIVTIYCPSPCPPPPSAPLGRDKHAQEISGKSNQRTPGRSSHSFEVVHCAAGLLLGVV